MIDFERWEEVKEIVQAALDLPAEQRAAYLDEACREDQELRQQVDVLLAVSSTRADFYDDFQVLPPGFQTATLQEGDEIGPYRIARPIGTGGMSTVYLADDPRHERQVAIKVLTRKPRRPRHEERTVARFRHPNIVALYDSGQIEGGPPYFVMEYIEGETITTYCEEGKLSVKERLRLFLSVCDAVAYAHRHLVIHRDLKPANILVTMDGVPKLLDFGIAKNVRPFSTDGTATAPEDRALTVAFASPEQLAAEETSTATDIYSLGVLLCLLLTGRLPYPIKSYHDLPWAIRNMEPEKPSQIILKRLRPEEDGPEQVPAEAASPDDSRKLARSLSGDIDAIVLKALRKEPDRRYSTVAELAADIDRHLKSEPVSARKGSRRYRAGKFIRRHAIGASVTALFTLTVLSLSIWLLLLYREATHQRKQAQDQAHRAEQIRSFLIDSLKTTDPWKSPEDPASVQELLEQAQRRAYTELHARPADQVALLNAIGSIYSGLGLRERAATVLASAKQIADRRLAENDPLAIESVVFFADALLRVGKDSEAEKLNIQALARAESVLGREHQITADILNHLGNICSYRDEYACAEEYYKQALAIRRTLFGESHEAVASTLTELGIIYSDSGKLQEAGAMYQEALVIRKRLYRGSHPAIAETLNALAVLHHKAGDYSEAEPLYRESIQMRRAALGDTHPAVIASLTSLGLLLKDQGSFEEAERMLREVVHVGRTAYSDHSPGRSNGLFNLAALLYEQGKYDEASRLFKETLEIDTAAFGVGHPKAADSLSHLGMIATAQGSYEEAERLLREALEIRRKELGERATPVAATLNNLGILFKNRGEFRRAEGVVREAVDIWNEKYGGNHPSTLSGKNNLAALLTDLRHFKGAEELLTESLATAREEVGREHKLVGAILMSRADLYARQNRFAEARSDIEQSLKILGNPMQTNSPGLARAWSVQGTVLMGLHQYEAAQEALLRSKSALQLYESRSSYWTQKTEKHLADLAKFLEFRPSDEKGKAS